MKIYKHTVDFLNRKIKTVEIEVEEKPKTFVVVGKQEGVQETRISKTELEKVNEHWDRKMFSFFPEQRGYIIALLIDNRYKLDKLNEQLNKEIEERKLLLELLKKENKNEKIDSK